MEPVRCSRVVDAPAAANAERGDGRLGAGEKTCVNVIGYLVETVDPGTEIEATLRLPGLALKLGARAPAYWSVPQR